MQSSSFGSGLYRKPEGNASRDFIRYASIYLPMGHTQIPLMVDVEWYEEKSGFGIEQSNFIIHLQCEKILFLMKSTVIKVVLAIVVIVLAYLLYASIMKPIRFQEELTARNSRIVAKLKDIRTAQTFYKQFNNAYTSSFDTLFDFLRTGKIPVVKIIADPNDTTFTKTINDTIGFIGIADSLYSRRVNFKLEDLAIIPHSEGRKFEISTAKVDKGGVIVPVIEIMVPYEYYLFDLDKQDVVNLAEQQKSINRYPGIRMGSLTEATTDGNWE